MMKAKQQLKNLTPYSPGKNIEDVKRELGLKKIVKLASNENPFGHSKKATEAIEREATQLGLYPDGYAAMLREKTAQFLDVEKENLIFGSGSDDVIQMICRTYLTPDSNTVMAAPTFPQYRHNAIIEGSEVREVSLKEGRHDFGQMIEAVDENTRIFWVCAVNNPTGEYVRADELLFVLNKLPSDVLVVWDEAYYEYVQASDYPDSLELLKQYPNLIITRTFSKAYGLAALRVGYGVAHPEVITSLEPVREPFNTTRMGQAAAAAALEDGEFINECREKNRYGLERFYTFCDQFDLSYFPSQGNFILIDFKRSGDEVFNYLLKQGYIVRSGVALGYPNSVRITIGNGEQTEDIIRCLSDWLS
jgi:histidinol-phosphate aminotransferase